MSGIDQYDKLIPVFGTSGKKWPQMRLFLNMVKDNYEETGSVRFAEKKYDEADAKSYKGAEASSGTLSSQFACFLNELLNLIDGINIRAGDGDVYGTAGTTARGAVGEREAGRTVGTSPAAADLGIVGGSYDGDRVIQALKEADQEWFIEFMDAITTGRIREVDDEFTFKTRSQIVTDLNIKNLFTGLQGMTARDGRDQGEGRIGAAASAPANSPATSDGGADGFLRRYRVGAGLNECKQFAGAGIPISYNWDKYVLGSLLKSAVRAASSRTSSFFNNVGTSTGPMENSYYRKVGDTTNLYTMVNGKETAVQIGSDEAKKIKMGQNCFDLGMRSNDAATQAKCYNLVKDCLAGKNIQNCKEFMRTSNYWTTVRNDVANLNLDLGRSLLESFGFPIVTVDNAEVGRKLNVFGNSTQWLATLKENKFGKTTFSDRELRDIARNTRLIGYLDAVAAKINSNPGVLNPDFAKDAPNVNTNAFAGTGLSRFMSQKYVRQGSGVPSVASVIALQNTIARKNSAIALYYGIPLSTTGFVMRGGGAQTAQFQNLQNNNVLPLRLSDMIDSHIKQFVNSLKAVNKDLDQKDKTDIQKLVAELKVLEDKLFKAAIYTSKYQDLVSIFGEEDTNGLITLDHLQQFVDKRNNYFSRTGKKQDALTSILKALADATQKETKGVSVSASKYDVSPRKE